MTKTLRWMAALAASLMAPLQALAAAPKAGLGASSGLLASLAVVLGLVALASVGAWASTWYEARQRVLRRDALAASAKATPRLVLVAAAAQQAAVAPLAEAPAAAPSGRRAQAVRSRRPALTSLGGFSQPGQVASQFGHLN